MHFIDEATIHVKAGDGGDGSSAMRREDNVPLGGPSGGDGGNGASVVFRADVQLGSLLDFRYKRHYKGERGARRDRRADLARAGAGVAGDRAGDGALGAGAAAAP